MGENLPSCIKYWVNEAKHDCYFLIGPEKELAERIGAMKTLLMGHSEPFRVMLGDSELAETKDIHMKDVQPETFRCFLKCVYGASSLIIPKLTFEESAKLLYLVEKYLVNDIKLELTNHTKNLLLYNIHDNIYVALSHPICYLTESLKKEILKTLKNDFDKIIKDDKFLDLSDSAISWMIQQDQLFVNEIEIWNAVLKWAKYKTDSSDGKILRKRIFDLFKYIRFFTMDIAEFRKYVLPSEILHEEEISEVCKAIMLGKPCSIEYFCKNSSCRCNFYRVSENIISTIMEFPRYAFIRCSVNSFQSLSKLNYSKTYNWAEHFWCFSLMKIKVEEVNNLSVNVVCQGKTPNWKSPAEVEISLINQFGKPDKSLKYNQKFDRLSSDWNYHAFYEWDSLLNPGNGFVKEDSIILMVNIKLQDT